MVLILGPIEYLYGKYVVVKCLLIENIVLIIFIFIAITCWQASYIFEVFVWLFLTLQIDVIHLISLLVLFLCPLSFE